MSVVQGDGHVQVVYSTPEQDVVLDIVKKPTGHVDVTTTDAENNYSFFVIQPDDLAQVVEFLGDTSYARLVKRQAATQIDRDEARDEVTRLSATLERVRALADDEIGRKAQGSPYQMGARALAKRILAALARHLEDVAR